MVDPKQSQFVVLAFRYGGLLHTFPIGVFADRGKAEEAAKEHRAYRGGKYSHRIYEFTQDHWDDDVGHCGNKKPCIEDDSVCIRSLYEDY